MNRAVRESGFTLLELLVAISLMGLIVVVLFGGIQFGTRVWDRTERRADRTMRWEAMHALLRRELLQIYPVRQDTPAGPRLLFDGTSQALHFVGVEPAQAGIAGLYRYDLALSTDGRRDLVLSWSLLDDHTYGDRAILAHGVSALDLRFFGAAGPNSRPGWHSAWRNATDLPRLVNVRIVSAGNRDGPPIEVTVAPRLWALQDGEP